MHCPPQSCFTTWGVWSKLQRTNIKKASQPKTEDIFQWNWYRYPTYIPIYATYLSNIYRIYICSKGVTMKTQQFRAMGEGMQTRWTCMVVLQTLSWEGLGDSGNATRSFMGIAKMKGSVLGSLNYSLHTYSTTRIHDTFWVKVLKIRLLFEITSVGTCLTLGNTGYHKYVCHHLHK